MNKLALFLVFSLLLSLFGCGLTTVESDIVYYYPRLEYTQNSEDSVIKAEIRSDVPYKSYTNILIAYLEGPADSLLANPFPDDLTVLDVFLEGNTVKITVSKELAQLSGVQLVLACSCLAKTAMGLTDTDACQIRCNGAMLDGKVSMSFTSDSIILMDEVPPETTTEP